jgi:hypothetical protein
MRIEVDRDLSPHLAAVALALALLLGLTVPGTAQEEIGSEEKPMTARDLLLLAQQDLAKALKQLEADGGAGLDRHETWQAEYDAYILDVLSYGEAVADWRRSLVEERMSFEDDNETFPKKEKKLLEDLGAADKTLKEARDLVSGELNLYSREKTVAACERLVGEVNRVQTLLRNIRGSLVHMREQVLDRYETKAAMDPSIEKAVAAWKETEAKFPNVMERWRKYLQEKWPKVVEDTWVAYTDEKEDFQATHEPLLEGTLFDGLSQFKGKEYDALAAGLDDLVTDLRELRAKNAEELEILERIREEREREEAISAEEWKIYMDHANRYGPSVERELRLAAANAAGGALGARELRIQLARTEEGTPEYRALLKKLEDHENMRLPEQVAAQKALEDFWKAQEESKREMNELMERRRKRRAKLDLSPDFR